MAYKLVNLRTMQEFLTRTGKVARFRTGRDASNAAFKLQLDGDDRYQPRVIIDDSWRKREEKRFSSGKYTKLPWHREKWWVKSAHAKNHFAHVSKDGGAMVAYTPDDEYGAADRQVRISPGKYLDRFFSNVLTRKQITDIATRFSAHYDKLNFGIARSRKKIRDVYERGPSSCMSGKSSAKINRAEPYAGPDLAVAYIQNDKGRYSARVVVWPEKKIYGPVIYGDIYRMEAALKAHGYKQGSLRGARLRRLKDAAGRLIVPYVDHHYVDRTSPYLTLRS